MQTNTQTQFTDEEFMKEALCEATLAGQADEVPVGAVVVRDGQIIARAQNMRERTGIATHHAEILAIEQACRQVGNWYLTDCDLYVTLEPCAMCTGAVINARIRRVVFGAYDQRFGCMGSLYDLPKGNFNHSPEVKGGVLKEECSSILTEFFRKKRK